MILTDREIQLAIENEQIEISPPPDDSAFSSTSLDLTLDRPGEYWELLPGQPIRPGADGYSYQQLMGRKQQIEFDGFQLDSGSFVLGWTKEEVYLPYTSRLAARVEGKSSLARLGLCVHLTAPTVHAGFRGQIQLEICNFGPNQIILDEGLRVCQLIFETSLGTPAKGYSGRFIGQQAR